MRRPKRLFISLILLLALAASVAAASGPVWPAPPADPVLGLESVLASLANFEVAVQGPVESKPRRIQKLRRPTGIALDSRGRLWMSDARQRVLLLVDPDLGVALVFGSGTNPSLREPRGVAVGDDGTVYVADSGLRGVVAFDPRGEVVEVYGDGWLDEPVDVALSPDGARLYVADAGANNIGVFDLATEGKVDTIGRRGKGVGEFYLPMAVEFDSAGNLLVVDHLNARIQIFDTSGNFRAAIEGSDRNGFTRPSDIAADAAGRLYVTDSAGSRVYVYGSNLDSLLALGRNGLGEGEFLQIGGIAAQGDQLAVLDEAGGRVQLFRLYGMGEPAAGSGAAAAAAPLAPVTEPIGVAQVGEGRPLPAPAGDSTPVAAEEADDSPPGGAGEPIEVAEAVEVAEVPPASEPAGAADETIVAQQLLEAVTAWAAAWADQDVERYLGFYSGSFQPADGSSRDAWAERRRRRVSGPSSIEVDIEPVETRLEGDRAQVTFLQSYRSDRYADRVRKTLGLVLEEGDWRIERETVLETLD